MTKSANDAASGTDEWFTLTETALGRFEIQFTRKGIALLYFAQAQAIRYVGFDRLDYVAVASLIGATLAAADVEIQKRYEPDDGADGFDHHWVR